MTLVSEISEFELIARLENILKLSSNIPDAQIKFAIGDDAAVITPNSKNQVITSDALVENVHFIYNQISMYNLGWKSLASNYSDVASMGCDPLAVSITLGIKKNQQVEDLEKIYEGFTGITNKFGGSIIGGDIVKSNDFFISISVIGQ
ncbi:MAG: thiamine-phosphate kinase, partial [Chloroflexi bacterium]|nr:thiamine-phosphate kinase [Chloroflexota bacterium]